MSQTEFGNIGSVTKKTQALYEKGSRAPDADYIAAIEQAGVDIVFVLTGRDVKKDAEIIMRPDPYAASLEYTRRLADEVGLYDDKPRPTAPVLTKHEKELLTNYRAATSDNKQLIEATARLAAKKN